MRLTLPAALLTGLVATPALAGDLTIGVEIPRMTVAEYHRPYVAIWIEKPDETAVKTLAVWYELAEGRPPVVAPRRPVDDHACQRRQWPDQGPRQAADHHQGL
jgi:hypothetical protein